MLGRALLRFPVRSRLLHHLRLQCSHENTSFAATLPALRTYATPGRPKGVVGEPSRPVKRAVKKEARAPADGSSAAEQQVRAKRSRAAGGKKAVKELTPEQKAAKKEKQKAAQEKQKRKTLQETALDPPPTGTRGSAWSIFNAEKMKGIDIAGSTPAEKRQSLGEKFKETAAQWKALTPAELEHYNHLNNQKKEAAQAEYKRWVESHTAEEIQRANNARKQLRQMLEKERPKGRNTKWPAIHDERTVKRPLNAFAQFSVNRHASGDFKNIALKERAKLIGQEWKALSEDEKQKYNKIYAQDTERYVNEFRDMYGHTPPSLNGGQTQMEAAAAA